MRAHLLDVLPGAVLLRAGHLVVSGDVLGVVDAHLGILLVGVSAESPPGALRDDSGRSRQRHVGRERREKAHAERPAFARRNHARRLERGARCVSGRDIAPWRRMRAARARGSGGDAPRRSRARREARRAHCYAGEQPPCSERGRRRREARRSCLRGRRRRDEYVERRLRRSRGAARGFRGRATRGGVAPGDTLAMRFFSRRLVSARDASSAESSRLCDFF